MEYSDEKCEMLIMKNEKEREASEGIELASQKSIRIFEKKKKENYK